MAGELPKEVTEDPGPIPLMGKACGFCPQGSKRLLRLQASHLHSRQEEGGGAKSTSAWRMHPPCLQETSRSSAQ